MFTFSLKVITSYHRLHCGDHKGEARAGRVGRKRMREYGQSWAWEKWRWKRCVQDGNGRDLFFSCCSGGQCMLLSSMLLLRMLLLKRIEKRKATGANWLQQPKVTSNEELLILTPYTPEYDRVSRPYPP